ncbi:MAG TPA: AsmA family protein [Candidatus Acidoferrales bacterium]|nr:AsmA family protein [Candidatus Acidoferrales bacterium]
MSETHLESITRAEPHEQAPSRLRAWSRWPKWILLVLVCLWLAAEAISLAIQHTRLHRKVTARIEAAFGRPVEVGSYDFSLWGGPVLEARSVTVGEDPRFGNEYFLRAESMGLRLRWRSLLRGHLEFGTLSLTRPSLNLVRDADGDWNLAAWLPRLVGMPAATGFVGPVAPASLAPRFRRIEVEGGRINFKLGDEKLPLAFLGVTGTVEADRPGRWRIDLQATPWRAAVVMQQAGTVHVSGEVGGTSSRLRPAALDVSWSDASVSDVLRLVAADDHGVRGGLALSMSARTRDHNDDWAIQGRVALQQVHRWDLTLRPDNPSLNLIASMDWNPRDSLVAFQDLTLDAPHSNARMSGRISWAHPRFPVKQLYSPVYLELSSSQIDVSDLLSWARAFHPGIADDVSLQGHAAVRGIAADWPARVVNAVVFSDGIAVAGGGLQRPAHLGQVQLRYDHGLVSLLPVALSFGTPENGLRFESSAKGGRGVSNVMRVSGSVSDVHEVIAAASAFGWSITRGWDVLGPVRADLRWQGSDLPWRTKPVGFIDWGAGPGVAVLRAPFLNLPIGQINARTEWKPGSLHIALESAQAFGARWTGTLDRREPAASWQFALSADRLATVALDRWLNPRWRESFLDRMLPFLNSRSAPGAAPEDLQASGRLSLGQLIVAPVSIGGLQGDLKIDGRHVALENATGQLYRGTIGGSFDADLGSTPVYHAELDFARVDVPSLIAAIPGFAGITAKSAAGQISLDASGATRADLAASLACQGNARVTSPELRNFDLWRSLAGLPQDRQPTRFLAGSAAFSCARGNIEFQSLALTMMDGTIEGSGNVGFDRTLDLRLQVKSSYSSQAGPAFRLTGPLAAPQVARVSTPPRRTR